MTVPAKIRAAPANIGVVPAKIRVAPAKIRVALAKIGVALAKIGVAPGPQQRFPLGISIVASLSFAIIFPVKILLF